MNTRQSDSAVQQRAEGQQLDTASQNNDVHREIEDNGFCILPSVLSEEELKKVRSAFDAAVRETVAHGSGGFNPILDPNNKNIRVDHLPNFDPIFVWLLRHPKILPLVRSLIGPDAYVSNFTANVALPGSGSMRIHSDQALVVPPPWTEQWALNMIWCLDDVYEANGATRYLPGSHRFSTFSDVPANPEAKMRAFSASAGSVIVMDGRVWHTSGANVTPDKKRAMLFAYYSRGFLRPQVNWDVAISPESKERLDEDARALLGMGMYSNVALALDLITLKQ